MVTLNQDIPQLIPDSPIANLFKRLYDGMVEANKAEMPSTDSYVDEEGNVDEEGIEQSISEYSDILMKNSAYNTAKSIIDALDYKGGGSLAIFPYTRTSSSVSDDQAIEKALNGTVPSDGNMVIIIDTNEDGSKEYGRTGFVYNSENWKPFCGRIDANKVIVRGDLILAGEYTSVGNINKGDNMAVSTLDTDGLSVMDVLNKIFSKVIEPVVVQPSINSLVVKANSISGASSVEVGSSIFPYWAVDFNPGSYTYNNSEVKIESCIVTNNNGVEIGYGASGISSIQVDITESNYDVTVTVNYTDGAVPITNMKNPSTQVQGIKAGAISKKGTISSYRKIFYGYSSSDNIDNSVIRALSNKANANMTISLNEDTSKTQIIIAAPKGTRNISKVIMPSSSNAEVTSEFIKQATAIKVAGANNYNPIDYDIWIYKPAKMAGTYTITIS